jgi:hypothetical protein
MSRISGKKLQGQEEEIILSAFTASVINLLIVEVIN